jgi:HSP20 family protein
MFLTKYQRPEPGLSRLFSLQDELDQLFATPFNNLACAWTPALDVAEDAENYLIHAELPGFKREDVQVSLNDGVLIITGERKHENTNTEATVHRRERHYGQFQRAVALPKAVQPDKVKAQFKDGVLTVTLPKSDDAKPKKIDVSLN